MDVQASEYNRLLKQLRAAWSAINYQWWTGPPTWILTNHATSTTRDMSVIKTSLPDHELNFRMWSKAIQVRWSVRYSEVTAKLGVPQFSQEDDDE
jgi:hypothetical protein